jgi:hypothetical protein
MVSVPFNKKGKPKYFINTKIIGNRMKKGKVSRMVSVKNLLTNSRIFFPNLFSSGK